ncbi:MAG: AbrB/MazE/SpoVT family DNA-binding domain-containing protein [Coriobacteriia bacterium]|nr:AbrB/MazE/SpoVT family DNA-binding domain-containing protein [Coriobacteriia bacterium]
MDIVTISPKFQVVIPKHVREQLKLVPGQTVQVLAYGDRIEFLPVRSARDLRGFLADTGVSFEREEDDRL